MAKAKKDILKVVSSVKDSVATIYLYGYIGQDDTYWDDRDEAKDEKLTDLEIVKVVNKLEQDGITRCNVRINSPGGSSMHGDGIMAALTATSMEVHMYADGICASKAADIFLSVEKKYRHMAKGAKLMLHCHSMRAVGNAAEMREAAKTLDKFDDAAIAKMAVDTHLSEEEIRNTYYDYQDHWLTADEALKNGFIADIEGDAVKAPDPDKIAEFDWDSIEIPVQQQGKTSILDRIYAAVVKLQPSTQQSTNKIEKKDMDIKDIKQAVAEGKLDLSQLAQELGFTKEASEEQPKTDKEAALEQRVADLEKRIKDFGDESSTQQSMIGGEDTESGSNVGQQSNEVDYDKMYAESAEKGRNPFIGV